MFLTQILFNLNTWSWLYAVFISCWLARRSETTFVQVKDTLTQFIHSCWATSDLSAIHGNGGMYIYIHYIVSENQKIIPNKIWQVEIVENLLKMIIMIIIRLKKQKEQAASNFKD